MATASAVSCCSLARRPAISVKGVSMRNSHVAYLFEVKIVAYGCWRRGGLRRRRLAIVTMANVYCIWPMASAWKYQLMLIINNLKILWLCSSPHGSLYAVVMQCVNGWRLPAILITMSANAAIAIKQWPIWKWLSIHIVCHVSSINEMLCHCVLLKYLGW